MVTIVAMVTVVAMANWFQFTIEALDLNGLPRLTPRGQK
jgi:hypothetical protein